jgi:hypothetical protein
MIRIVKSIFGHQNLKGIAPYGRCTKPKQIRNVNCNVKITLSFPATDGTRMKYGFGGQIAL